MHEPRKSPRLTIPAPWEWCRLEPTFTTAGDARRWSATNEPTRRRSLRKAGGRSYLALSPTTMADTTVASLCAASRVHTFENDLSGATYPSAPRLGRQPANFCPERSGKFGVRRRTQGYPDEPFRLGIHRHIRRLKRAILDNPDWDIGIHPFQWPQSYLRTLVQRPPTSTSASGHQSMRPRLNGPMSPLIRTHNASSG